MMRSPDRIAISVRNPEGGIVTKSEPFVSLTKRKRLMGFPVIRGAVTLVETFVVAVKALSFSAEQAGQPDEKDGKEGAGGPTRFHMIITVIAALALGFVLFFYIPLVLTEVTGLKGGILFNLVDGLIRMVFIVLYIVLISRWKEMQRIFEYHGAEHKVIFAFEDGEAVTPDAAMKYPRRHPRCSTSFLMIVVLVSIILFIMLGRPDSVVDRLVRFSLVPVIGGVSYEALKLSAKPSVGRYISFMMWPGIFLQNYTTREPDIDQLEVAAAALSACLEDKNLES